MTKSKFMIVLIFIFLLGINSIGLSQETNSTLMRRIDIKKLEILKKALEQLKAVEKEKDTVTQHIIRDRSILLKKISILKKKKKILEANNKKLQKEINGLEIHKQKINTVFIEKKEHINDLVGQIRANAKDLISILRQSPYSAIVRGREKELFPILKKKQYPGMKDIRNILDILFDEMVLDSEVLGTKGKFINREGEAETGEILLIGPFTSIYRTKQETGFLLYSDKSQRFFALSKLPPHNIKKKLNEYLDGKSKDVYIDISKGGALRQLVHSVSLLELIPKGGPLVWPILFIGAIAILLIIERFVFLFRCKLDEDFFMNTVRNFILKNKWEECISFCKQNIKKPLVRVILNGIENRNMEREEIENVLQESILNEIPRMERFLSTLGMFAAISPLLGLLGTVTGMINTFHVITLYGSNDPKMMSSGISEALVTTMLGLSVAIPIMLFHSIISKKVEDLISKMEECGVSIINLLCSNRV